MSGTEVNPQRTANCPACGASLPTGVLAGLCPACLLKEGATADTATQSGAKPFEPPPVQEVAGLFPQLEILNLLGKGGMGAVYKARQPALDRFVALKILPTQDGADPGFAERFTREARALARLSHPNIVGVHEFGRTNGLHFFIMEFVDGVNLRQLQQTGRLSPREALQIVPQICDALQYAHDEGVVHRDIKPENVLVDRKGRVKIADFGLAKILGLELQDLRLTGEGQIMGTPHYMAPEQVEHPQEVDHRADIFSLGVVFYEMLTGELPLGKFAPPSRKVQVDVRLDEVVLHALEKEPERRYQHANEVKTAVQEIVSSRPGVGTQSLTSVATIPVPRWALGVDYRSKASLWGLPLLHVATGLDPATGKRRAAKGIIAIGNVARGLVAIGGVAIGGVAIGGLALGAFACGGLAVGLIAFGGVAGAVLAAFGGGAVALIAAGGGSVGYWAYGGLALGVHTFGGLGIDPKAWDFFQPWVQPTLQMVFRVCLLLCGAVILLSAFLPAWLQRRDRELFRSAGFWGQIAGALLGAAGCILPGLFVSGHLDSQPQFLVTGQVRDSRDGMGLPNATLTVFSSRNVQQVLARSNTDSEGKFSFMVPRVGDRMVTSAVGYDAKELVLSAKLFEWRHRALLDLRLWPSLSSAWSPTIDPGQKPDFNRIRDEANDLRAKGQYQDALDRYLWYWNHALEYEPSLSGVRLSFLLGDWIELGRRFPPARQALEDIRARDTQEFQEGRGYFDLFQDLSSLNQYLQDDQATYELFMKLRQEDPALAGQCFFVVKPLLIKHGDYALCLQYLGGAQNAFSRIRQKWETQSQWEKRQDENSKRLKNEGFNLPAPPKMADHQFVSETRELILVLAKTGHKTEAAQIQNQALALVDNPQLRSAMSDAEEGVLEQ